MQAMEHQRHSLAEFKKMVDALPDMFEQDERGAIRFVGDGERIQSLINEHMRDEDVQEGDDVILCE